MSARLPLLAFAAALAGCNTGPPERDTFVPPYAEKGCWARLYGEPGFRGAMRELEGPVFVEALGATPVLVDNLRETRPQPLFIDVRSVELGPHARLDAFAEPLFRAPPALAWGPGTRVADSAAAGFPGRIGSFRLQCVA